MSDLVIDERRRAVLDAACDTLLPAQGAEEPGPAGDFLRRGARELGSAERIVKVAAALPPHVAGGLVALLDELGDEFVAAQVPDRTERLVDAAAGAPATRFGLRVLKLLTFGPLFGPPGEDGHQPVWEAVGYPGPISRAPTAEQAPKTLPLVAVGGDEQTLEADVCIVGSGAGGSVIASRLAAAGARVLVLEMGSYKTESDFLQLEAAAGDMYLGGGLLWSEHGDIGLLAGSVLGGGTVINSMVCLRTPTEIRESWAKMGLEGVDGPEWERCIDAVWERLGVNTEATHYSENTLRMISGLSACGYGHERIPRNASLDDDPRMCGYCNWGCQQGCKRSTTKTYLEDAARDGARFVVGCRVERVTTAGGRATGVEATVGPTRLRVLAPTVVVAAGGLESPALLLRSGIGGPAVGGHLTVHPTWFVTGVYPEPITAWDGQIQSAVSLDLVHCESGVGFLVETVGLSPGFWATQSPFVDGVAHREALLRLGHLATWHAVSHDHGSGRVVLDADGRPLVRWALADDIDRRVAARAHVELARLHHAAGAEEIFTFHLAERRWREGEDFSAFLDELRATPPEQYSAYSAHQMSSCRLGSDPQESVADGRGELHDVHGVWIGDASGLPTAPGVNPMISIMALAERTAAYIAADLQQVLRAA